MSNRYIPLLLSFLLLVYSMVNASEVVVIIHPGSGIDKLNREDVINIFLGRFRQLPSGISAQPIDLPADQPEKANFYHLLVNKELSDINSYWARLQFSGRIVPPRQARSTEDLLNFISSTPGAVGYLDRTKVDTRVKVILDLTAR
ncbi:conserved hypothetical protein [Gammaproteobacteria bacterium]